MDIGLLKAFCRRLWRGAPCVRETPADRVSYQISQAFLFPLGTCSRFVAMLTRNDKNGDKVMSF
jgi:hypothetical protein